MVEQRVQKMIGEVIVREGGYVNHPADRGGIAPNRAFHEIRALGFLTLQYFFDAALEFLAT